MKSSLSLPRPFRTAAVVFAALAAAGWALRPLEQPAWEQLAGSAPELSAETLSTGLGQGAVAALLGGFRPLAADLMFLKASDDWSDHNLRGTVTNLRLTTALDPRSLYFWVNGARWMAYDMPGWRVEQAGGWELVPASVQLAFTREQAALGISFLDEARRYHPESPLLLMEIANIHLIRLKDHADAADYYGRAAALPGAPYIAARLHGRELMKARQPREALDWFVKLYPTLPKPAGLPGADRPPGKNFAPSEDQLAAAAAGDVLDLIRELEQQLGVPPEKTFRP